MYNTNKYAETDFLEQHCTARLLQKLKDEYEYDGEGLAFWLFRSTAQDVGPEESKVTEVSTDDGLWYNYKFLDGGWHGENRVKCVVVDGKVWMDDVERVYDEPSATQ